MNTKQKEFEKLISDALIDGVLTDRERIILREKGMKMGLDADEVDVILDARQYEIMDELSVPDPFITKCPKCGETLSENDTTCPSCDAVIERPKSVRDEDDEDEGYSQRDLTDRIAYEMERIFEKESMKYYDKGANPASKWILIICTGGLYLIYLLVAKRAKSFFDPYSEIHHSFKQKIESYCRQLQEKSGNTEFKNVTEAINQRADLIIRRRRLGAFTGSFTEGLFFVLIIWGIYQLCAIGYRIGKDRHDNEAETKKELSVFYNAVAAKKPYEARESYNKLHVDSKTHDMRNDMIGTEADSLLAAKNYDAALEKANLLGDGVEYKRDSKVTEILREQIPALIEEKKLEKAEALLQHYDEYDKKEFEDKLKAAKNKNNGKRKK